MFFYYYPILLNIDINLPDLESMFVNLAMVARKILMLPITDAVDYSLTTTNPPPKRRPAASFNMTGLVTGLIAAIVVASFLLVVLAAVIIIFCKFHQTRKYILIYYF